MFKLLIGMKIVLYSLVIMRAFEKTPLSFPLVSIALVLLVSGFWRSYYKYADNKVNISTLLLDLILAVLFSFFSKSSSFDKLFFIYLTEGTAILPKPFFIAYTVLATVVSLGSIALFNLRESGQMQLPGIAELLLYVFAFGLVLSERRQRELRLAYEKLTKELRYVNLQLQESMTLSESLSTEAERRRIAGEIHDSLGHSLTGLILALEAGKKLMSHNVEAGKSYFDKAIQISRTALHAVRELVSEKKEAYLEFELISRLRDMVQEVRVLTGLRIDLDIQNQDLGLSGQEQFNMYRIFQEAITNTLRHANADRAQITISGSRELLSFSYWDNGSGTNRIVAGNGLKGMNERIGVLGAAVSFQSESGRGFRIEGRIDRRGENNE